MVSSEDRPSPEEATKPPTSQLSSSSSVATPPLPSSNDSNFPPAMSSFDPMSPSSGQLFDRRPSAYSSMFGGVPPSDNSIPGLSSQAAASIKASHTQSMGPNISGPGGLSAASSRRPSFAAEFSSRPRLHDLSEAFNRHGSIGNPAFTYDHDSWLPSSNPSQSIPGAGMMGRSTSLWSVETGSSSGAGTGTGLDRSPTREEFMIPVPPSQKKSFRSLSVSQNHLPNQPVGHGSYLLGSFNEDDGEYNGSDHGELTMEPADTNSMLHGAIGQASASLWNLPGSRRHSYAGENRTNRHQEDSSNSAFEGQHNVKAQEAKPQKPTMSAKADEVTSAAMAKIDAAKQSSYVGSAIDKYFSVDVLGRNALNESIVNGGPPSPLSLDSGIDMAALISVPSKKLYFVQFKSDRVDVFFIPESSSLVVKVGDLVIVDADRGRDLGRVVKTRVTVEEAGILKYKRHQEQLAILQHNPSSAGPTNAGSAAGLSPGTAPTPGLTMPKQILRYAQANEIQQIPNKEADEEKAVSVCLHKVKEKELDMNVLDAEYQWDRRKLTFFYSANHRIDFRDLVRELFRIYKTRIWMCAVNSANNSSTSGAGSFDGVSDHPVSPVTNHSASSSPTRHSMAASDEGASPPLTQAKARIHQGDHAGYYHQSPQHGGHHHNEYGLATAQLFRDSSRMQDYQQPSYSPSDVPVLVSPQWHPQFDSLTTKKHANAPAQSFPNARYDNLNRSAGPMPAYQSTYSARPVPATFPSGPEMNQYWYGPPPANTYY